MIIVGAGLSGLIAGSMLRNQCEIWEAQEEVPNNHSALLRFRSSVVGDATGIPFKKVRVMKAVQTENNPVAAAVQYSLKCTGKAELRSVVTANGEIEERFIAPDDFIPQLAAQVKSSLRLGVEFKTKWLNEGENVISTIPMPMLMDLLDYRDRPLNFGYVQGTTITCDLPELFDMYATVYLPDEWQTPYRASITGNHLIIEIAHAGGIASVGEEEVRDAVNEGCEALGIEGIVDFVMEHCEVKTAKYSKISPIDDALRKRFILWATEKYNIYSLGRFATWRPGLLLDDVVNDVRMIQRMVGGENRSYSMRKSA